MKLQRAVSGLWGFCLALMTGFSSVACLVTAFDMGVSLWTVFCWCAASAAVCSLCFTLPLKLLPPCAAALLGGYLWKNGSLEYSVEALLYRLSRQYDRAYSWGLIRWNARTADDMEPTLILILCVLGALTAMAVAWAVCRKRTAIPGVVLGVLPLGACLVVTDTVPDTVWLYLLILGVAVLLLTNSARRQDENQGNRLCAVVAPAAALALLVLFAAVPQEGYTGHKYADAIVETNTIQTLLVRFTEGGSAVAIDSNAVDLTSVGVRLESEAVVLEVSADFSDTLYLRSRAMDSYDGKSWRSSDETGLPWPTHQLHGGGEVVITTRYAHQMLYLPYYVTSLNMDAVNRGVANENQMTQYSLSCKQRPAESYLAAAYSEVAGGDYTAYLHLSDEVMAWAQPVSEKVAGKYGSVYERAQAIGDYVRSCALYDKNTYRMPSGEADFVRWFLEDSDTGYCIHFASAATVLLQAAGIPARYVTGYTAQVTQGETTKVIAKDAHAWAEYWLPGFGWTVLEATPADVDTAVQETLPATTAPDTTQATVPNDTTTSEPKTREDNVSLTWLLWLAVALLTVALAQGQRYLRRHLADRRRSCGSTNARALICWEETVRFAQLLGEPPDKTLFALAQKAKFSQHTLTAEELVRFDTYANAARAKLQKRSVFHRFYYRYILAVY